MIFSDQFVCTLFPDKDLDNLLINWTAQKKVRVIKKKMVNCKRKILSKTFINLVKRILTFRIRGRWAWTTTFYATRNITRIYVHSHNQKISITYILARFHDPPKTKPTLVLGADSGSGNTIIRARLLLPNRVRLVHRSWRVPTLRARVFCRWLLPKAFVMGQQ